MQGARAGTGRATRWEKLARKLAVADAAIYGAIGSALVAAGVGYIGSRAGVGIGGWCLLAGGICTVWVGSMVSEAKLLAIARATERDDYIVGRRAKGMVGLLIFGVLVVGVGLLSMSPSACGGESETKISSNECG